MALSLSLNAKYLRFPQKSLRGFHRDWKTRKNSVSFFVHVLALKYRRPKKVSLPPPSMLPVFFPGKKLFTLLLKYSFPVCRPQQQTSPVSGCFHWGYNKLLWRRQQIDLSLMPTTAFVYQVLLFIAHLFFFRCKSVFISLSLRKKKLLVNHSGRQFFMHASLGPVRMKTRWKKAGSGV